MNILIKSLFCSKLFLICLLNAFSQTKIEIKNTDIDNISLIAMSFENDKTIRALPFKTVGKTLIVEEVEYGKIRLSHIGFYDTTIIISSGSEHHIIALRPKVTELQEIIVREPKSFTVTERKNKGNNNMLFALEENRIWYFEIDLSVLEVTRLEELSVALEGVNTKNSLEVTIFETIHEVVKGNFLAKDTVKLSNVKNNFINVYDCKANNIVLSDNFVLGLKIIPTVKIDETNLTYIVTAFRSEATNIYLQSEKGVVDKMPNAYYLEHFKAYPYLIKKIKYTR